MSESVRTNLVSIAPDKIPRIEGGGGGPHDPAMEVRLARLEEDSKEVRADMKRVLADLSYVKGRLESLPTTWAMITTVVGAQLALAGLLTGLVFAVARMFGKG